MARRLDPVPAKARAAFNALVERLRATPGIGDPVRDGFGDRPLYAGTEIFAHLEDDGQLVLQLPPERAEELIETRVGVGWGVQAGAPMMGYLGVSARDSEQWYRLAAEAHSYMAGKDRRKAVAAKKSKSKSARA